jgi:hypothetical protein
MHSLSSVLDEGGQLHVPAALPPGKGSQSRRLDAVVKRKIPSPRRESNPDNPIGYYVMKIANYKALLCVSFSISCYLFCLRSKTFSSAFHPHTVQLNTYYN